MTVAPLRRRAPLAACALAFVAFAVSTGSVGTAHAAEPLRVGLVPLDGDAPAPLRSRATEVLRSALLGIPDLEVTTFDDMDRLFGPGAAARLEACADDGCIRRELARVKTDVLALGSLSLDGTLRLRLVDSATTAKGAKVRVSRSTELTDPAVVQAVTAAALELFPERADGSFGLLALEGGVAGAEVLVDGASAGQLSLEAPPKANLRVPIGKRTVKILAPGHAPYETEVEVTVGQRTSLAVSLDKNRSSGPLYLAGGGLVAAGAALTLGLLVNQRASNWEDGCSLTGPCDSGFTRARYDSDQAFVDGGRIGTNVLWAAAGTALVGAIVWFFVDPGEETP